MAAKVFGVAAAGFALAANAFMIPSTMTLTKDDADKLEQIDIAKVFNPTTASRVVELDCPECVTDTEGPSKMEAEHVALVLEFSTSKDSQALTLNGRPFFPHAADLFAPPAPVSIPHGLPRKSFHDAEANPQRLFYASKSSTVEAADGSDAQLIDMDFQIHGLGHTDVTVDSLSIRILKDEHGQVRIADIIRVPKSGGPARSADEEMEFSILPIDLGRPAIAHPSPDDHPANRHGASTGGECHAPAVLCRLKQKLEHKMEAMRHTIAAHRPHSLFPPMRLGCGGKAPGHNVASRPHGIPIHGGPNKIAGLMHPPRPGHPSMMDGPGHRPHRGHRGGRHGHHGHRRPGPMHTALHVAHRAFFGFVLPVLIGVAAGMMASIAGMLVGTLLAFLWVKVIRGGRKAQVPEQRAEEGQSSEKVQLLSGDKATKVEDEALPVYVEKE